MGRRKRNFEEAKTLYDNSDQSNALFEKFYRALQLTADDEEWERLMHSLRQQLPCTFRVTGFREHSRSLLKLLRSKYLEELVNLAEVPAPQPLPWYPQQMAYQLQLNRLAIRKVHELQKLHNFLVTESETGHISRQEAVSMIPPLVLGVQSGDRILDMCAAPGSKTAQLIELLHADSSSPSGVVVANDVDQRRAYLMVHQVKRLQSPSFVVCTHDSGVFPRLRLDGAALQFERVLADVPCSGDGTIRKNPGVWRRWKPGLGNNLHLTQAKILRRGVELLAVGGRCVYSTCSLNPVENEAVVAKVLKEADGSLELVDCRQMLPGLRCVAGLAAWRVMGADGSLYASYADVPQGRGHAYLRPSFFADAADSDSLRLQRCIRVLPHLQDTGGFFVAAIEKKRHLPWMNPDRADSAADAADKEAEAEAEAPPASPKSKRRRYNEDPFLFLSADSDTWRGIASTFGIGDDFPVRNVLYRCENSKKRHLYLVNDVTRRIVEANPGLKAVNMGVKIFSVCDDNDYKGYRALQEGLTLLEAHITLRRVRVPRCDLLVLLEHELPFADKFTEDTRRAWRQLPVGPCVIDYQPDGVDLPEVPLCLAAWRGRTTLRAYMKRHDRLHLTRLCGVEDLQHIMGKTKDNRPADADADDADAAAAVEDEGEDQDREQDEAAAGNDAGE